MQFGFEFLFHLFLYLFGIVIFFTVVAVLLMIYRRNVSTSTPELFKAYLVVEKQMYLYKLIVQNTMFFAFFVLYLGLSLFIQKDTYVFVAAASTGVVFIFALIYSVVVYKKKVEYVKDIEELIASIEGATDLKSLNQKLLVINSRYFGVYSYLMFVIFLILMAIRVFIRS